jgi:uncharacterized protein YabN with tetrapyrrole methylase and pyrophosphatase domain
MKKYTMHLVKEIVTHVEAESRDEAVAIAREFDANGWDGLWLYAEPQISVIEESEIPDEIEVKMMKDQSLIDAVIEQIEIDLRSGDMTALDEMLKQVPEVVLRAYLSDVPNV